MRLKDLLKRCLEEDVNPEIEAKEISVSLDPTVEQDRHETEAIGKSGCAQ